MLHTNITPDKDLRNQPLGGLVAAVHMARANNPKAQPLPRGFAEHSKDLPNPVETWAFREFADDDKAPAAPMFRTRAAR